MAKKKKREKEKPHCLAFDCVCQHPEGDDYDTCIECLFGWIEWMIRDQIIDQVGDRLMEITPIRSKTE